MDQKKHAKKTKQHKFIVSNHKQDLLYNFTKLIWSQRVNNNGSNIHTHLRF